MINTIEKYPILSLLACVILMLGFTIDAIPVSIMEARNFISAREMLTDNNWILTTMNGEARYEKPPLPTWITAIFGYIFGITSVLALRWPAILMVAVTSVCGFKLCKSITGNHQQSVVTGFITLSSFYIIGITIEGPWDIYAHGFMLVAIYQLIVLFQSETTSLKHGLLFILFLAASILPKGPVSLYVLFLSFVIAYGFSFGFRGPKIKYLKLMVFFIFGLCLGGWWYFHVRLADPETFVKITSKETANWSSYNVRPFYYYWSFFIQSGLWTIPAFVSLLYPYLKRRVKHKKAYKFTFLWTVIAVVLLSVIPEKKSRYLMPVLIPLALNIGFYIEYLIHEFKTLTVKKETLAVYFNFGLIGLIAVLVPLSSILIFEDLNGIVLVRFIILSVVSIGIGISIFQHLKKKNIKIVFYLVITFMLSLGFIGLPMAKLQIQTEYHPITYELINNKPLYALGYIAPEVIYNYGTKIPDLYSDEGLIIPNESDFFVLSDKKEIKENSTFSKLYTITFVKTFDMNTASKGTRAYKPRLVNYLFKLSRQ